MNNNDFRQHFINACTQLSIMDYSKRIFDVIPVLEEGKTYTSKDDIMRLCLLPKPRRLDFEDVVSLFTRNEGYYPLWIQISLEDEKILLRTSLRMRKAGPNDDGVLYPFRL